MKAIVIDVTMSGAKIELALATGRKSGQAVLVLTDEVQLVPPAVQPSQPTATPVSAVREQKIRELVRLAQEQGYLTYSDINDALDDTVVTPEDLDEISIKLRNLEVEIADQVEVDRAKEMSQVPLLTPEQEVEISKRLKDAENEIKRITYSFGFSGKEHIALAEKLISEPPKERFDRVIIDKKIGDRENHLEALRKLIKEVRAIDQEVDDRYAEWQYAARKANSERLAREFQESDQKLQTRFNRFYYNERIIEEIGLIADNIHDKIQASLRSIEDVKFRRRTSQGRLVIKSEVKKIKALEEFVRMPHQQFLEVYKQFQHFTRKALQAKMALNDRHPEPAVGSK